MKKNKYLFFDFIHNYGGAQKSTVELIGRLVALNVNVEVIDPVGMVQRFKEAIEYNGSKYRSFNLGSRTVLGKEGENLLKKLFRYFKLYIDIVSLTRKEIKRKNYDVVWTNSFKSLLFLCAIKIISKIKIYFFIRGIDSSKKMSRFKVACFNKFVDKVFIQNVIIKNYIIKQGINKHKIEIIPNVVSIEDLNNEIEKNKTQGLIDPEFLNIFMAATIVENKGYLEAVEALEIILRRKVKAKLLIAGDFKDEKFKNVLLGTIKEKNLQDNIEFLGYRTDVPSLIQSSDIIILPSYSEGMPRVIMEAMALGKPVIVTKVGGVSEFVIHKNTGVLIETKNSRNLGDEIFSLIENPLSTKKMANNGKKLMLNNYSESNQISVLKEIFNSQPKILRQ